jgi:hypothetical protein
MKTKLIKRENHYDLFFGTRFISTTDCEDGTVNKLSKQNCNEIFGIIDVEKLAYDAAMNYLTEGNPNGDFKKSTIGMDDNIIWWKAGFNKAMELNQQTEIEVEIVMDILNEYNAKLDADGCLILKQQEQ